MRSWQFPVTQKGNKNPSWLRKGSLEKRLRREHSEWGDAGLKLEIPRAGGSYTMFYLKIWKDATLKNVPHRHKNDSRVEMIGWGV